MEKKDGKSSSNLEVVGKNTHVIQFGQDEVDLIKQNKCEGATPVEFNLFLYDAQSRGLNPLRNEIYFVKRGGKATHQVGIDGFRKIAQSTGEYEGQTKTEFGSAQNGIPEYAEVGVYRRGFKEALYARAYFKEYAQSYNGKLGTMWAKMPHLMIAKCAESLALRKAFPAELAGLYTGDEMGEQASEKEIKASDYDVAVEVTESNTQCATRTQEKIFEDTMLEYGRVMRWMPLKITTAKSQVLSKLGVEKYEDLTEVQAEKLNSEIYKKLREKISSQKSNIERDVAEITDNK